MYRQALRLTSERVRLHWREEKSEGDQEGRGRKWRGAWWQPRVHGQVLFWSMDLLWDLWLEERVQAMLQVGCRDSFQGFWPKELLQISISLGVSDSHRWVTSVWMVVFRDPGVILRVVVLSLSLLGRVGGEGDLLWDHLMSSNFRISGLQGEVAWVPKALFTYASRMDPSRGTPG